MEFRENRPLYSIPQLTHSFKSKGCVPASRQVNFHAKTNSGLEAPHVLGQALSDFLDEFPFANAGIIAQ
jgi:hypothetical protein